MEEIKMNCPNCAKVTLVMAERQGIEIDYCPQCRGVWLDRGELDKLIERATPSNMQGEYRNNYYRNSDDGHQKEHYYKKRKSFLSEIFD